MCRPWTMDNSGENEASKDPGICQPTHQGYTEQDFEGKKFKTKFLHWCGQKNVQRMSWTGYRSIAHFSSRVIVIEWNNNNKKTILIEQDIEHIQYLLVFICQEVVDIHIDVTNTTTGTATNPQISIDQVCYFHVL